MSSNLEHAQDIILGKIDQICGKFGLNNIMAQLYGVLYLNDGPMSLGEMAGRLKLSKGSISVNIRTLERYGVVRKVWVKGTRQDYYEAEYDIAKVIIHRAKAMVQNRFSEIDEMIRFATEALPSLHPDSDSEKEAIEVFKTKLEKIKNLYNQAKGLFDLLNVDILTSSATGIGAAKNSIPAVENQKETLAGVSSEQKI